MSLCYAGNCTKQTIGMWMTCAAHNGVRAVPLQTPFGLHGPCDQGWRGLQEAHRKVEFKIKNCRNEHTRFKYTIVDMVSPNVLTTIIPTYFNTVRMRRFKARFQIDNLSKTPVGFVLPSAVNKVSIPSLLMLHRKQCDCLLFVVVNSIGDLMLSLQVLLVLASALSLPGGHLNKRKVPKVWQASV